MPDSPPLSALCSQNSSLGDPTHTPQALIHSAHTPACQEPPVTPGPGLPFLHGALARQEGRVFPGGKKETEAIRGSSGDGRG